MNAEEPQPSQKNGIASGTPHNGVQICRDIPAYFSADTTNNTLDHGAKYAGLAGDHCLLARIQGLQTDAS
jgi:hypothetical protein